MVDVDFTKDFIFPKGHDSSNEYSLRFPKASRKDDGLPQASGTSSGRAHILMADCHNKIWNMVRLGMVYCTICYYCILYCDYWDCLIFSLHMTSDAMNIDWADATKTIPNSVCCGISVFSWFFLLWISQAQPCPWQAWSSSSTGAQANLQLSHHRFKKGRW